MEIEEEISQEIIQEEIIKEFMDEPEGYYLYVNLKSDDKYYLLHIDNDKVIFIIDYGFSITKPNLFVPINIRDIQHILKTYKYGYDNINLEKPIFKESNDSIRIRTLKRKLENPSFPQEKRIRKTDGKRKSKRKPPHKRKAIEPFDTQFNCKIN